MSFGSNSNTEKHFKNYCQDFINIKINKKTEYYIA